MVGCCTFLTSAFSQRSTISALIVFCCVHSFLNWVLDLPVLFFPHPSQTFTMFCIPDNGYSTVLKQNNLVMAGLNVFDWLLLVLPERAKMLHHLKRYEAQHVPKSNVLYNFNKIQKVRLDCWIYTVLLSNFWTLIPN